MREYLEMKFTPIKRVERKGKKAKLKRALIIAAFVAIVLAILMVLFIVY